MDLKGSHYRPNYHHIFGSPREVTFQQEAWLLFVLRIKKAEFEGVLIRKWDQIRSHKLWVALMEGDQNLCKSSLVVSCDISPLLQIKKEKRKSPLITIVHLDCLHHLDQVDLSILVLCWMHMSKPFWFKILHIISLLPTIEFWKALNPIKHIFIYFERSLKLSHILIKSGVEFFVLIWRDRKYKNTELTNQSCNDRRPILTPRNVKCKVGQPKPMPIHDAMHYGAQTMDMSSISLWNKI